MSTQFVGQIAIQLDHCQLTQTLDQGLRQSRQTRANFDHRVTGLWCYLFDDGFNDPHISQKMLPKPFTGNVFHCVGGSRIST